MDAVPVPVLDGLLRDAIEALRDPARVEANLEAWERESERLPEAIRAALDNEGRGDDE